MGSGARVPIRFDPEVRLRKGKRGVGGQGLFPGAIVALKGKNGGGGSFLASEILSVSTSASKSVQISILTPPEAASARLPLGWSCQVRELGDTLLDDRGQWAVHCRLGSAVSASSEPNHSTQVGQASRRSPGAFVVFSVLRTHD